MSGKSKEEIAFDLVSKLKGVGVWGEHNRAEILDMYAECLEATSGLREFPGRTTSAERLRGGAAAAKPDVLPVKKPAVPHPAQNQVPPAFQPPVQTAPQVAPQVAPQHPPQQPVHQQQQMVQQAYQQPVQR